MNDRIKQIASQCWDLRMDGQHFDQEKFAELIVEDCLFKIRVEAAQYLSPDWRDNLVNNIKEHFGVSK